MCIRDKLKTLQSALEAMKLITKEDKWSYRSHFKFHAYEIRVQDVRLVGPQAPQGLRIDKK